MNKTIYDVVRWKRREIPANSETPDPPEESTTAVRVYSYHELHENQMDISLPPPTTCSARSQYPDRYLLPSNSDSTEARPEQNESVEGAAKDQPPSSGQRFDIDVETFCEERKSDTKSDSYLEPCVVVSETEVTMHRLPLECSLSVTLPAAPGDQKSQVDAVSTNENISLGEEDRSDKENIFGFVPDVQSVSPADLEPAYEEDNSVRLLAECFEDIPVDDSKSPPPSPPENYNHLFELEYVGSRKYNLEI